MIGSKLRALSKESAQFFEPATPTTKKSDTAKPSPGRHPLAEGPRCGIGSVAPNRAMAGIEVHVHLGSAVKLCFRFARRIDPMGFAGGDHE